TDSDGLSRQPLDLSRMDLSRRDFIQNSLLLMCGFGLPIQSHHVMANSETGLLTSTILQSNMLGFNGERIDSSTGLYPLGQGYRWYNPVLRRFCQYDRNASPFGIGGGNGYAFAMNNPIGNTDPSGHGIIAAIISFITSIAASISTAISTSAAAIKGTVSLIGSLVGQAATLTTLVGGASSATSASVGSLTATVTKTIIYSAAASGITEGFRASAGSIALASGASDETAQFVEDITYNLFAAAFFFTAALAPITTTTTAARVAGNLGRTAASLGVASQVVSATAGGLGSTNSLKTSKLSQASLWLGAVADALVLTSAPLSGLKVSTSASKYNLNNLKTSHTYRVKLRKNNLGMNDFSNKVERLGNIGVSALESASTNLAVAGYYGQDSTINTTSKTMTVFNHGTMASLNHRQLAGKEGRLNFLKEGLRTVRIGYKGSWALNAHLPLHEEAFYGRDE
ncbi:RHS repeat-associated core domain-containing protein, partial [Vibrio genomosp. F10]